MPGILFVVATPIGNLKDLSERAVKTLASVDVVLCEDTRVTGKLLKSIDVKTKLESYHQHSHDKKTTQIVKMLMDGLDLALVTDAGTPGISDPGGMLIEELVNTIVDVKIVPIPGPSAAVAALSVAGFPADEFVFLGFPPNKKGRKKFFDRVADISSTITFYESTHRIHKTMEEVASRQSSRLCIVGRELTKLHETIYRGTVQEVTEALKSGSIKGEFVIVLAPFKK